MYPHRTQGVLQALVQSSTTVKYFTVRFNSPGVWTIRIPGSDSDSVDALPPLTSNHAHIITYAQWWAGNIEDIHYVSVSHMTLCTRTLSLSFPLCVCLSLPLSLSLSLCLSL